MELKKQEIIKALEIYRDTISPSHCAVCILAKALKGVCEPLLFEHTISLIKQQDEKIFQLENRLKECENGYEGTLFLERCKLHDAEQKIKELTAEYDSMAKSVNEASELIRSLKSRIRRLEAYDEQRDIALHARLIRDTKVAAVQDMRDRFKKRFKYLHNVIDKCAEEVLRGE